MSTQPLVPSSCAGQSSVHPTCLRLCLSSMPQSALEHWLLEEGGRS